MKFQVTQLIALDILKNNLEDRGGYVCDLQRQQETQCDLGATYFSDGTKDTTSIWGAEIVVLAVSSAVCSVLGGLYVFGGGAEVLERWLRHFTKRNLTSEDSKAVTEIPPVSTAQTSSTLQCSFLLPLL